MSHTFNFDGRTGQLLDTVSGSLLTNSGVEFKQTEKGLAGLFDGASYLKLDGGINPPTLANFYYSVSFKLTKLGVVQRFFDARIGSGNGMHDYISTSNTYYFNNNFTVIQSTRTFDIGVWYNIAIIIDNTGLVSMYINNVLDVQKDFSSSGAVLPSTVFNIGTSLSLNQYINGYISSFEMEQEAISDIERNKRYEDFIHSYPLAETKYWELESVNKLTSLNEDGLSTAFSFIHSTGGVLTDISNNGNNGKINGGMSTDKGIMFSRAGGNITFDTISTGTTYTFSIKGKIAKSVSSKAYLLSIGGVVRLYMDGTYIISDFSKTSSTHDWRKDTNPGNDFTLVFVGNGTTVTVYYDGVSLGDKVADAISKDFDQISTSNQTRGWDEEVSDFKFYNRVLSLQEVKDYHNSYANEVYYKNNFEYEKADGTNILPQEMIAGTGSYKIDTVDLANETSLTTLGTNYLECTSAGTIAYQSEQAYGTWEFDVYKGAATGTISIYFLSPSSQANQIGAYDIYINSSEAISLNKSNLTVLFSTDVNYILVNTWYRIKITRTTDGEFTMWIKGGSFGDVYTIVDTTGGSGTNQVTDNTYTTSNYSVLDLDSEDRTTNILYRKGVAQ